MIKINPLCLDCRRKCKQKEIVVIVGCPRYHQADKQLELRFAVEEKARKKKTK